MPTLSLYLLDAFTLGPEALFSGNPAAVCPLEQWLDDAVMQGIAAENNLSETAFFVAEENSFELRWFTPKLEVPLCGHATLATAYVIFNRLGYCGDTLIFQTKSGTLTVTRQGEHYVMDFPSLATAACAEPANLAGALGKAPREVHCGTDYLAVYQGEQDILNLAPDFQLMKSLDKAGVIATAPGNDCDFVSRYFAPAKGVDEDPVTGRIHCVLAPFWAKRLGRDNLKARQLSDRGGAVDCIVCEERVQLAGQVSPYLEGTIRV